MADVPRLFLITPPIVDAAAFAPLLEAAVDAGDVACLLIRAAARDERGTKEVVRLLAPIAQQRGTAVLVEQDSRLAMRLDVDGVHVSGGGEPLEAALAALKANKIVGVGGLEGRDAAMAAGEAGADYLMFGGPQGREPHEAVLDLVAWWAQIFNVPCVGYVGNPDLAADMAAAGAEFIGLCQGLWDRSEAISETLAAVSKAVAPLHEDVP